MRNTPSTGSIPQEREAAARELVGKWVAYAGTFGLHHGQTFEVVAADGERLSLRAPGADRVTLSAVKQTSVTLTEEPANV